jgi:hypothetical protein
MRRSRVVRRRDHVALFAGCALLLAALGIGSTPSVERDGVAVAAERVSADAPRLAYGFAPFEAVRSRISTTDGIRGHGDALPAAFVAVVTAALLAFAGLLVVVVPLTSARSVRHLPPRAPPARAVARAAV